MLRVFVVLQGLLTQQLHRDDRGATAVEYCLIVALIAIVIVTAVAAVGTKVNTLFSSAVNAL
jgi:pilus assembly protein Flp/PilA